MMQDEFRTTPSVGREHTTGVATVLQVIASEAPRQHDMLGETGLFIKHGGPHEDDRRNQECWSMAFRLLAERNYCRRVGPMWKFKRPFRPENIEALLTWSGVVRAFDLVGETR
jgi:hypothetical protein